MKKILLFDVSLKNSNIIFKNLKQKYKKNEWLCIYFHWNKMNILSDKKIIDNFEKEFNMNVNWIDISKINEEVKKVILILHKDFLNELNEKFILNLIKTYLINLLCKKYNAFQIN